MAITNKVYVSQNVDGNMREDVITFSNSETSEDIPTRLAKVVQAYIQHPTGDGATGTCYINSNTTSDNVAGYSGQVHVEGLTDDQDGYELVARGW